jgi:serine/threonine protein kinase
VGAVSLAGKTLLGRYRVVRPLGQGALATVYLAFDPFGTPYALKLFPKGAEARRNREFWVGKRLDHPNLNPVLEKLDLEEGSRTPGKPWRPSPSKYPTAAFAAVGAPEKPSHSPDLSIPCCETKVRALSGRRPRSPGR